MSTKSVTTLEEAIRSAGEAWLIDWHSPPDQAIPNLRQRLAAIDVLARQRLGGNAPNLHEDALVAAFKSHPTKVKGFFQVLGGSRTPEMLLMAWRIIQGMEVKEVSVTYHRRLDFHLHIVLESPHGDPDETYESTTIQDFALFRHIGIMEIDRRPVFDGFYALNVN